MGNMPKNIKFGTWCVFMVFAGLLLFPSLFDLKSQMSQDLISIEQQVAEPTPKVVWRLRTIATGYSSTPDQTDDTPFITAANTCVREGIVAANFVPLGTKIRLPELYGDKIFVVEDRMHRRKNYLVDIWFPTREQALNFGAQHTLIEVLEG